MIIIIYYIIINFLLTCQRRNNTYARPRSSQDIYSDVIVRSINSHVPCFLCSSSVPVWRVKEIQSYSPPKGPEERMRRLRPLG